MARILCIANQKGGVGKTTTAVNLAVGFARADFRTLLVDLDPQCNATSGLGIQPTARHPLLVDETLQQSVRATGNERLDLLPGSRSFQDVDALAQTESDNQRMLAEHLRVGVPTYDFVLVDCPPSIGRLTEMALIAADEILMPVQCEYFAMEGLTQMIDIIRRVMQQPNKRLDFAGIVLTMYDPTLELTAEVDAEVREFFGEIVFDTVIPRDVAVSEAPSHGTSVIDYAPRSRGARAYIELCMEVIQR
jgi:chromosome partitioning protein